MRQIIALHEKEWRAESSAEEPVQARGAENLGVKVTEEIMRRRNLRPGKGGEAQLFGIGETTDCGRESGEYEKVAEETKVMGTRRDSENEGSFRR